MEEAGKQSTEERDQYKALLRRGWIIVLAIALLFVIYGLFAYFIIGDNQPADWDFGAVKDVPGESVYSTYPYRDRTETPEPQHVNQKPPNAIMEPSEQVAPIQVEEKPGSGKLQHGEKKYSGGIRMCFSGRTVLMFLAAIAMLIALTCLLVGCDYARMKDQESIRTYESQMPEGVEGTIPIGGGIAVLKSEGPSKIRNPLPSTPEVIERGRTAYGYFCVMCHGPKLDGNGTVGQSFSPLPADLISPYVQQQNDGTLFYRISLGYKRHPPLASTMAVEDRWAAIGYIQSVRKQGLR